MKFQTLGEVSKGRNNTFDFLRFFLASLVIFSHSFALLYDHTLHGYDPLLRGTKGQEAFGGAAVEGFFLISGFLITMSWEHCKGTLDFACRRVLRIIPALVVILVVSVFIIGPLTTNLPLRSYFASANTYSYFTMMGTVDLHLTDRLPGVFEQNPLAWRVNGSLWTIRCELLCYILVGILGLTGGLRKPILVLLASMGGIGFLTLLAMHAIHPGVIYDLLRVLTYFLCGTTFYLYRDRIPHSFPLFLIALTGLLISDMLRILAATLPILGAYALFYIAFKPVFGLQNFARLGDYSYGLYLYAFPVEQALVSRFPHAWNVSTAFLATLVVSVACAALSWHFIEKPFLQLKKRAEKPTERPLHPTKPLIVASLQQPEHAGKKP